MSSWKMAIAGGALLAAAAAGLVFYDVRGGPRGRLGEKVEFGPLESLDGPRLDAASFAGKAVLIVFHTAG